MNALNYPQGTVIEVRESAMFGGGRWVRFFRTKNEHDGSLIWKSEDGGEWSELGPLWTLRMVSGVRGEEAAPTPEQVYNNAIRENQDNLRWWKEGYAEGYNAGFDAGREYQLEQ